MSTSSSIEWTDATWNPIIGCSKVSPGCANCYAERMAGRLAAMGQRAYQDVVAAPDTRYGPLSRWNGKTTMVESALDAPLHWRKPRRVFVCSMSDLFHPNVPTDWIDRVFAAMALCPQHTFQVLTKRPERAAEYLARGFVGVATAISSGSVDGVLGKLNDMPYVKVKLDDRGGWPPPNVWLGTSVEDQQRADERIPHLLRCPAAVRFLSLEPLLGPVDLTALRPPLCDPLDALRGGWHRGDHRIYEQAAGRIRWVIVGGESGPKARPCNVEWIRSIVRQCADAQVPCFVKQVGARPYVTMDEHSRCNWGAAIAERHINDVLAGQNVVEYRPHDPKGGDPAEWPADLRVRQWPQSVHTEANR
jgi:protein gp37